MAHFLVGDGHYCGRDGELQRWQRLLERAVAQGATEISILGDFFELWIALPGLMPQWQHDLLDALRPLKARGVRLRYVVGNKDYFVERWNAQDGLFDEVVPRRTCVPSPLGPLVLAHGDLVNRADRQYRAWRALSRSAAVTLVARLLPRAVLNRVSSYLAQRLARTNLYHKSYFPEAELRARAREHGDEAALFVYGHFHVHRELTEGNKRVVTLPFLGADDAGILITATGMQTLR